MAFRLVAALIMCAAPIAVSATVLLPAEFREIVTGSDVIVYGRVSATEVRWSDDRRHVDTLVTIQAGTYLKGRGGDALVFKVPGGTIGRYMNVTIGAPTFGVGDEAVFFLNTKDRDMPAIFGLNQGVFRVATDARTRRRVVTPPVLARGIAPEAVKRGDPARKPVPLEAFGAQVQSVIGEAARAAR